MISFGFVLVDNSRNLTDELIGVVIAGTGREGLIDYYKAIGDPRGVALRAKVDSAIRALDYTPPVDLSFGDYLSALVTADSEVRPRSDDRYELRKHVLASFRA